MKITKTKKLNRPLIELIKVVMYNEFSNTL